MKNVLIQYINKDVLYTMPDEVFEVCHNIYETYNIRLHTSVHFPDIYEELPDDLRCKIVVKEGKRREFIKVDAVIREIHGHKELFVN